MHLTPLLIDMYRAHHLSSYTQNHPQLRVDDASFLGTILRKDS